MKSFTEVAKIHAGNNLQLLKRPRIQRKLFLRQSQEHFKAGSQDRIRLHHVLGPKVQGKRCRHIGIEPWVLLPLQLLGEMRHLAVAFYHFGYSSIKGKFRRGSQLVFCY